MESVLVRSATSATVLAEVSSYVDSLALLSASELSRHGRFVRAVDRDDFVAARGLARLITLRLLGIRDSTSALCALTITQVCDTCGGPHGKPRLSSYADLTLSWAHSHGVVAAAVGPGPLGVDVEHAIGPGPHRLGERSPRTWHGWTRAEALVKTGACDLEAALALGLDDLTTYGELCFSDWTDPACGTVGTLAARVGVPITIET